MSKKMKLQVLKEFDIDNTFKKLIRTRDEGSQFIFGRELAKFWGYKEWRNFLEIIKKGMQNYQNTSKANENKALVLSTDRLEDIDFEGDRDDRNPDFT